MTKKQQRVLAKANKAVFILFEVESQLKEIAWESSFGKIKIPARIQEEAQTIIDFIQRGSEGAHHLSLERKARELSGYNFNRKR